MTHQHEEDAWPREIVQAYRRRYVHTKLQEWGWWTAWVLIAGVASAAVVIEVMS